MKEFKYNIITFIIVFIVILIFVIPIMSVKDIEKKQYTQPSSYKSEYTWDGKLVIDYED